MGTGRGGLGPPSHKTASALVEVPPGYIRQLLLELPGFLFLPLAACCLLPAASCYHTSTVDWARYLDIQAVLALQLIDTTTQNTQNTEHRYLQL
jgi:hypothetical protein